MAKGNQKPDLGGLALASIPMLTMLTRGGLSQEQKNGHELHGVRAEHLGAEAQRLQCCRNCFQGLPCPQKPLGCAQRHSNEGLLQGNRAGQSEKRQGKRKSQNPTMVWRDIEAHTSPAMGHLLLD